MPVEVILDVFSGRPNPRWVLSDAQTLELVRRIASLSRAQGAREPTPPDLGYRGFQLEAHDVPELPGPVHVYGGFVRLPSEVRLDPQRRTERWLLESNSKALEPPIHELVLHEIEGRV